MNVYQSERVVGAEDLDDLNHVNNVRYVQWIQEISKAHWERVVPEKIRKNLLWVVRRHDIHYKASAHLGDHLMLTTYIAQNKGFISSRIVEIRLKDTEKLLLNARTDWCLLSRKQGKPMRISREILTLFETPSP